MKISLNQIEFYQRKYKWSGPVAPDGAEALVQKIGAQLGAVEEVIPFGKRFEGVLVVKVVYIDDHPGADRLHVCMIDDGRKAKNVERDENGHVQIICGAPNVHVGMLAAWLPPGATVPSTIGKEPFVLEARDMRGKKSYGMLASPRELTLGDSHEGILDITLEANEKIAPGTTFVDAYHLKDDIIIDIENKMFTHRPDCFGLLGVAREIAGIQGQAFESPDWWRIDAEVPAPETTTLPLEVHNEIPKLVPRFVAVALSDIQVGPSPTWLQVDLARVGLRPINNIVDLTNFYMLLTGQPIHAYDYDKVKALGNKDHAILTVRHPKKGEKITLLNGKQIEPRSEAMMVAAGDHLVCVGGAMGGADTEVSEQTKNIIIEAATWDMYNIRRTSMAHGIFTDAVTRFTKGQSPLQNVAVVAEIVDKLCRSMGAKIASPLLDDNHVSDEVIARGSLYPPVQLTRQFVCDRLGFDLSADAMKTLLTNVEFDVDASGDELTVEAPFWRTDIELPEDVVEEIGRLYGYDHLPLELPKRDITPAPKDPVLELKNQVRLRLSAAGANEVLTYNFVHGNLLQKAGQDGEQAFRLSNALSPDLQYLRVSLTPSLLDTVHSNIKAGHDQFALFEINKVHHKNHVDAQGLPEEYLRIALVFAAEDRTAQANYAGAPYYQARKYMVDLLAITGLMPDIVCVPLADASLRDHKAINQMMQPFEPSRSAAVMHGDILVGVVGEYRPAVARAFKLPAFAAGFELLASALVDGTGNPYVQLPRFPKVEQDICLKVDNKLSYHKLFDFAWHFLEDHRPDHTYQMLSPVDIYQRKEEPKHRQITLRLTIASYDRTLTDSEVNRLLEELAEAAKKTLQAERI